MAGWRFEDLNMQKTAEFFILMFIIAGISAAVAQDYPAGTGPDPILPQPYETGSARRFSRIAGWEEGAMPKAPAGFRVTRFAGGLDNPRWIYVLPNGDVLVSQAKSGSKWFSRSPNNIILLRDRDGDGVAETRGVFASGLNRPFGMALVGDAFYVAGMDILRRFAYRDGDLKLAGKGQKILDLPAGGYNHHWTRNIVAAPDGKKLYVSVGSASNVGEGGMKDEKRRAAILEINPDGSGEKNYATGLRNPVGMAWEPETKTLWTAVNERDGLGDELVPDFMMGVKEGAFYGWPYFYFGRNPDPRWAAAKEDMPSVKATKPDYALGSHTASLGLAFYTGGAFPEKYRGGAFVGQHGSWNRSALAGYKVIFVPFTDGKPSGPPEDFLTGFIKDAEKSEVYGRPAGVAVAKDGSLLVADDAGNAIWRVAAE